MFFKKNILVFAVFFFVFNLNAQDVSKKAIKFINTLSSELKEKTLHEFTHKDRFDIKFIPKRRKGTSFNDFNKKQTNAAIELLKASLSKKGYNKTSEVMKLEGVLKIIEKDKSKFPNGASKRDPLNYHFWIFGNPVTDKIWGWKFEGHHISLNFVSSENKIIASTPSFYGANPGIVDYPGIKKKSVLKLETDLAFDLLNSMSKEQLKTTVFSVHAPKEVITGNVHKFKKIEQKGILYRNLSEEQKEMFDTLLNVYLANYETKFSKSFRSKIKKHGFKKLSFAWAGSLKVGEGHYYRIQGPNLLIEYGNTQNNANHIHTVVRDLTNDFGEDVLKNHYHHEH